MDNLPIACTLTNAELEERRQSIIRDLRNAVSDVQELDNGYAYSFGEGAEHLLARIGSMIGLERQCCPFLRFTVVVESNSGPIRLELTGPNGTKEFLKEVFG